MVRIVLGLMSRLRDGIIEVRGDVRKGTAWVEAFLEIHGDDKIFCVAVVMPHNDRPKTNSVYRPRIRNILADVTAARGKAIR